MLKMKKVRNHYCKSDKLSIRSVRLSASFIKYN